MNQDPWSRDGRPEGNAPAAPESPSGDPARPGRGFRNPAAGAGPRSLVALGAASAAFIPLWPWLWDRWTAEGSYFDHGPLVLPVAVLWAWLRLRRGADSSPGPAWPSLLLAVPASGGLMLLAGRGLSFLGALGWWFAVGALVAAAAGSRTLWRLVGPWTFLLFLIPWPLKIVEDLSVPLKDSATALGLVLAPAGAVREGNSAILTFPDGGRFVVGDVCSGLRGIIGALGAGYLLAGVLVQRFWRRALVLLAGGLAAWIVNALRIAFLIAVGLWRGSGATAEGGWAHDGSGMVSHVVILLAIIAAGLGLGRGERRRGAEPVRPAPTPFRPPSPGWACAVIAVIALGWLPRWLSDSAGPTGTISVSGVFPGELVPPAISGLAPLRGRDVPLESRAAAILSPDECLSRVYGDPEWCHLLLVHGSGSEARIHAPEICFRGAGFEIVAASALPVPDPFTGAPDRLNEFLAVREGERRLVWYWFRSGGVSTSSYPGFAWRSLWRPGDPQVLVWLSCPLAGGEPGEGRERLRWTLRELAEPLGIALTRL